MTLMPSRPLSIQIAALLAALFFASVCGAQNDEFQEAQKLFRGGQHAQAVEVRIPASAAITAKPGGEPAQTPNFIGQAEHSQLLTG